MGARTPAAKVLAHLHMLVDDQPTNAAVLLFGRDPQQFVPSAEVRCMHFHGTEIQWPAPNYQVFKGRLFDQADRAVDFVLSVINRSVGTRIESGRAPVAYEIPPDVVREAIVNAVVHRDYALAGITSWPGDCLRNDPMPHQPPVEMPQKCLKCLRRAAAGMGPSAKNRKIRTPADR